VQNERIKRLRQYIELHGEASIEELMKLCSGCSSMTLWRDLKKLEDEGAIRRKRGGAIALRLIETEEETMYSYRSQINPNAKKIIADLASEYIQPGCSIYLDAGSTIMAVAQLLPDKYYNIVTSATNIATELSQRSKCNVTIVGGQVNGCTFSCSGLQAEAFINGVNIDIAIMATSGFSLRNGFTSGHFNEHQLKRKVIEKAKRVVMLMDMSKLNKSMPFTFAALQNIDVLICDAPLPGDVMTEAKRYGVKVCTGEKDMKTVRLI